MVQAIVELYENINLKLDEFHSSKGINWYDYNYGQFEKRGEKYPVDYPAVYYEIGNVWWINSGTTAVTQYGTVQINFNYLVDFNDENLAGLPENHIGRKVIHDILTGITDLNNVITSITGVTFNKLTRLAYSNKIDTEKMLWNFSMNYFVNICDSTDYTNVSSLMDMNTIKLINSFLEKCCGGDGSYPQPELGWGTGIPVE